MRSTTKFLGFLLVMCAFLAVGAEAQNVAATSASGTTSAAQAPTPRKKRVAVFDFDYATVQSSSAAMFGSNVDIGKGISDCL